MSEKKNFIERVMAKLTGGDQAKVERFQSRVVRFCTKQISIRTDEIAALKDNLTDLDEKMEDTVTSVNFDKIKSAESIDSYVGEYIKSIDAVHAEVEAINTKISDLEKQIARFKDIIATLS